MSSSVIIQNPLCFMNETYLKKKVLQSKYDKGIPIILSQSEYPTKIIITFPSSSIASDFITEFKDTSFEPNYSYTLQIDSFNGSIDDLKADIATIKAKGNKTELTFAIKYEDILKTEYENTMYEPGLIYKNQDVIDRQTRTVTWLLTKLGSNIISGQPIMTTSMPVFIFDKRTMHQVFAYEHRNAPYYLTKASYSTDKFERLKWVIVYVFSQMYLSTFETKPFSPIIGETYQCRIGDLNMYIEQTVNHPITANFYCFDDNHQYTIHGYMETVASTGANTVYAMKKGKYNVTFKDGSSYSIHLPGVLLKGTTMGQRVFNFTEAILVIDNKNGKCAYIKMNPDEVSYMASWISSKQKTSPDTIRGAIVNLTDVTVSAKDLNHVMSVKATKYIEIEGFWTEELKFDGDEYWNVNDYSILKMYQVGYQLPSDGALRPDVIAMNAGDEDTAQNMKETLEKLQRADRKLRQNWKEKTQGGK